MYNNQLTGSIPASLGRCVSLQELVLYKNQLTGSIPASLGSCVSLQTLGLNDNQLTGSIPDSLRPGPRRRARRRTRGCSRIRAPWE